MSPHQVRLDQAKSALDKVFSDDSVELKVTLASLEALETDIETYITAIKNDMENE